MSNVTIYHNPRCSKSRQTLELIKQQGVEPDIVLYLQDTPNASELSQLLELLKISPRQLLRKGEADYKENNLSDPGLSDSALIDMMIKFPKLIERPIVVADGKAVLGRPPENVLEIL